MIPLNPFWQAWRMNTDIIQDWCHDAVACLLLVYVSACLQVYESVCYHAIHSRLLLVLAIPGIILELPRKPLLWATPFPSACPVLGGAGFSEPAAGVRVWEGTCWLWRSRGWFFKWLPGTDEFRPGLPQNRLALEGAERKWSGACCWRRDGIFPLISHYLDVTVAFWPGSSFLSSGPSLSPCLLAAHSGCLMVYMFLKFCEGIIT